MLRVLATTVCLLCVILTGTGTRGELSYPCPPPPLGGAVGAPENSLPDLADQFMVHVEANIVQKQMTSEAVEVYDYPNKRAVMSITSNNKTVTSIFNYATGERFDLLEDGSCKTRNLSDASFDVFGFTELKSPGTPTIKKVNDLFKFGDSVQKTFIGETEVRGIPVYHWRSCQTWKVEGETRAAYVLDYFFSKPEYSTASKRETIPVRAIINGTAINVDSKGNPMGGSHDFSHVYEFSFFRPIEDESVFEIPRGTVCRDRLYTKPLPQLPDQFSLSMEVYIAGTVRPPMTERMLFDYDFGLIQIDRYAPRGRGQRFGLTKLTVVEDYDNHAQYVIDSYDGNCSITAMPEGLSTSGEGHGTHITMKHGQELLKSGDRHFVYQGQRTLRDMKVDVWANATGQMVQEIYFLADWPSDRLRQRLQQINLDLDLSRMNILVGTYLLNTSAVDTNVGPFFHTFGDRAIQRWGSQWRQDARYPGPILGRDGSITSRRQGRWRWSWEPVRRLLMQADEKMINIFNYMPLHMDLGAFDVSVCYKKKAEQRYVYLTLEGNTADLLTSQRYAFLSSTKSALAKAAQISMLRIAGVNVWQDIVSAKLNFFFSVLEPPPVPGVPPQPSVQTALSNLAAAVHQGLNVTVGGLMNPRVLHVVPDSIKSWSSLENIWLKTKTGTTGAAGGTEPLVADNDSVSAPSQSGTDGYTTAQFGGMAFGMLLVGMLVGVLGVYVALRKFRPDIHLLPYQQTK